MCASCFSIFELVGVDCLISCFPQVIGKSVNYDFVSTLSSCIRPHTGSTDFKKNALGSYALNCAFEIFTNLFI